MMRLSFLLFSLALLTACGNAVKQPAVHDFGQSRISADSHTAALPDLSVEAPEWLQDNRIRYRLLYSAPTQVRYYAWDRWLAAPSKLLEQRLISEAPKSNDFLIIRLLEFEQQFATPTQAKVLIRLIAEVYGSDRRHKMAAEEFRFEQATRTPDADGAIKAFSELVQTIPGRMQDWLDGLDAH